MGEAAKEKLRWNFLAVRASETRAVKPSLMMYACQPPAQGRQRQEDRYKFEGCLVNIGKLYGGALKKRSEADKMACH